ncbi:MAG: cysteine desulfurase [Phycisphaerales bacterium]|nr:cysteine desulfurase [Phycisphaerales bacterium]
MVYLDHNATTRPTAGVVDAVTSAMVEGWGNPSSVHRFGQEAKHSVEVARTRIAKLLGVRGGGRGVVFTGTGSEAIALGIRGTISAMKGTGKHTIVTSSVEHSAVRELCDQLGSGDAFAVRKVGVDGDGVLDFDALESELRAGEVGVVSVQWVNNETGVVQDVGRIGRLCRAYGAVFHCDATQWVGKMETRVDGDDEALGSLIDVLTCSPHKFHGVKGVGVLWARSDRARRVRLVPMVPGSQELGRRGGTEGVPAIVGAGVAAMEAEQWLATGDEDRAKLAGMRDRLENTVVERCSATMGERVMVNGGNAERMWNVTNLGFPALEAEALLLAMSERGLCASAGAACASGSLESSEVLVAMGVEERVGRGSVRLSLSRETTEEEIDRGIEIVCQAVEVVGRSMV